jgi:hypothetical protein
MQSTASWQRLLRTSNQTEVVSLPVNRYWPTNIVAPGFTAYNEQQTKQNYYFSLFLVSTSTQKQTELPKADPGGKKKRLVIQQLTRDRARDVVAHIYIMVLNLVD